MAVKKPLVLYNGKRAELKDGDYLTVGARVHNNPSDPATTTSTTGVMKGFAISFTPSMTGVVLIVVDGDFDNSALGDGCAINIRTGTGTAPTDGAALTGTIRGTTIQMLNANQAGALDPTGDIRVPFGSNSIVTGLTLGTAYWCDLSLAAVTGGTARMRNVSISIIEI